MNRHEKRRAKVVERQGDKIILDRVNPHDFDGRCELCGAVEELRPYGSNNENICFECGMKDEATTGKKFAEMIDNQS